MTTAHWGLTVSVIGHRVMVSKVDYMVAFTTARSVSILMQDRRQLFSGCILAVVIFIFICILMSAEHQNDITKA